MSKLQSTLRFLIKHSEFILSVSVLFYWYSAGWGINWLAIGLMAALLALFFMKQRVLGIVLSCIFLLLAAFGMLALFSELSEFEEVNASAIQLFTVGSVFIGGTALAAALMLFKYSESRKVVIPSVD